VTKIKICGLSRPEDIEAANDIKSDYVGFVFAPGSKRRVDEETVVELKKRLDPAIETVGVFVDEDPGHIAWLLDAGVIDIAQLHGHEGEGYLARLRSLTTGDFIQAVRIEDERDIARANASHADIVLLDGGAGAGRTFDWELAKGVDRPFFLAGGLDPDNVAAAIAALHPFAVDVSSGVETDGVKDRDKMAAFAAAVRKGGVA
jgi:phosphoribosylanthranilate isomerase